MRSLRIRPIANSVKILTAGALLAAGTAGCALPGASAADGWTATARADAVFRCSSDSGCNAGGVGPVKRLDEVSSNGHVDIRVGAWKRTVSIQCKGIGEVGFTGTVEDANWTGLWTISKSDFEEPIDGSSFPVCPQ